jgi:cytochrome c553
MNLFKLKSVAVAIGLSALSNLALADISTSKAVLGNDGSERLAASADFTAAVEGDLYIAIGVEEKLLFLANGGNSLTERVSPFAANQVYIGSIPLFNFSTAGISAGRYPVYKIVTRTGTDPLNFTNWVGGLTSVNFMVGLPVAHSGDFDGDGFADSDLDQDGYYDDDLDKDGFHDDDHDKDGYYDDDHDKDGWSDSNGSMVPVTGGTTGKALYAIHCAECHGVDPSRGKNDIYEAVDPRETREAINENEGGMGILSFLTDAELQAIAAYVRNPN